MAGTSARILFKDLTHSVQSEYLSLDWGKGRGRTVPILSGKVEADGTISTRLSYPKGDQSSQAEAPEPSQSLSSHHHGKSNHWLVRLLRWISNCFWLTQKMPVKSSESVQVEPTQKDSVQEEFTEATSLCDLPNVLLEHIMYLLPNESLWSLRQSSIVFFKIFDTKGFRQYHGTPGLKDRYIPFSISLLFPAEKNAVATLILRDRHQLVSMPGQKSFQLEEWPSSKRHPRSENRAWHKDTYCAQCIAVLKRDEYEPRLINLRRTRFCDGCKERHAGIFFPPESLEGHDSGIPGELICIGRLGKVTLCAHDSHKPLTWQTLQDYFSKDKHRHSVMRSNRTQKPLTWQTLQDYFSKDIERHSVICSDRSHKLYVKPIKKMEGSALPRLALAQNEAPSIEIKGGWDLPLLDINLETPPSTEAIRKTLADLIKGAFCNHRPCRHMRDGKQIQEFAYSGICQCFREPCNTRYPEGSLYPKGLLKCSCRRKARLDCFDCGAVYTWYVVAGRIALTYRYEWAAWKPTSLGWLNLLDEVPHDASTFTDDTKHFLWCDRPGCATGRGRRWDDAVKEETCLQHVRYGKDGGEARDASRDYENLDSKFHNGLPWHEPGIGFYYKTKWLQKVNLAAKAEGRESLKHSS